MKIITFDKIKSLGIHSSQCYRWAEYMIRNKKNAILPPKISMKPYDGVFCNVMPSIITSDNNAYAGVKIVTRYPLREPSLDSKILLCNAKNGEYLALFDGDWITSMRTGAVAAHSIMLLAKHNYQIIGAMGLGNVTRATTQILLEMNPHKTFLFKLLQYKGQEKVFAERFSCYPNFFYEFFENVHDIVNESDVLISGVTYASTDFCQNSDFPQGILVVPIHTLGFTNCDLFFDKVFGDDYSHICNFKNFSKFKQFTEISDVINGKALGRENDNERILAYNIGISIHDINFAVHIYELLKDNSEISDINLDCPKEKFWV